MDIISQYIVSAFSLNHPLISESAALWNCRFPSLSLSPAPLLFMLRKPAPDLDSLESPLISANPWGSILGVVPGSALAERIFNDPDSWQGAGNDDNDDGDLKGSDTVSYVTDEAGKCQVIGEGSKLPPIDRDMDPSSLKKLNLAAPTAAEKPANCDGIAHENKLPFPPLFDHTSLDLSLNIDLRFSKIWDAKGKRVQSLHSPVYTTNEPKTLDSFSDARLTVPPALNLGEADNTLSPIMSPLNLASTSTTWSILEWYGVNPNTPRVYGRMPLFAQYPSTPYHAKSSALSSLREFSFPSANETVTTHPPPSVSESTMIRRLPVAPDPYATSSRAPAPSCGGTLTPQRTKSPEQAPLRLLTHQRSVSATPPTGSTLRSQRTPRGSATFPAPTSSLDPLNSSPSSTPIRTGNIFTRKSPAGPRPRSNTNSIRQRQASGRDFTSQIVIESEPATMHAHKHSSSPDPCLGMSGLKGS